MTDRTSKVAEKAPVSANLQQDNPQGLNKLRKNSLQPQCSGALCQGMTSVVPQTAENKVGL
jgi:hypothetical protein